jgi:hypothetical protein
MLVFLSVQKKLCCKLHLSTAFSVYLSLQVLTVQRGCNNYFELNFLKSR